MTLLICPVRPGDSNEELRYAMRSWEANLILPNLHLMIVGHRPAWAAPDDFVPGNQYPSVLHAVWDNVRLGASSAYDKGYEEAIYMNDDFFCMDPVGAVLPVKRNCTLAQHIAQFRGGHDHWWPRSLVLTADWLRDQGFPHPDSYEAHRPLFCKPEAMLSALDTWDRGMVDTIPQWRTVYGVLNGIEAYPVVDAKLGMKNTGFGTPWVSTADQSWRRYAGAMRQRFQKPSRWET